MYSSNKIAKEDIRDTDIVDAEELGSDGYFVYKADVTVISTTNATSQVVISGFNIFEFDDPVESGDRIWLSGTSGADGYYTIDELLSTDTFSVVETIADSTGGLADFMHPAGASRVGYNNFNQIVIGGNNVQQALDELSNKFTEGTDGQILISRGATIEPEWLTPASASANGSTNNPTKNGTTFTVIPEMTVDITSNGLPLLIIFKCTFNVQNNDEFDIALFQDGTEVPNTRATLEFHATSGLLGLTPGSVDGVLAAVVQVVTGLTDGQTYTFDVRWSEINGTARARETQRRIEVREIP